MLFNKRGLEILTQRAMSRYGYGDGAYWCQGISSECGNDATTAEASVDTAPGQAPVGASNTVQQLGMRPGEMGLELKVQEGHQDELVVTKALTSPNAVFRSPGLQQMLAIVLTSCVDGTDGLADPKISVSILLILQSFLRAEMETLALSGADVELEEQTAAAKAGTKGGAGGAGKGGPKGSVLDSASKGDGKTSQESSPGASEGFYLTKVVKEPPKGARGLLDGGATNSLRTAKSQKEIEQCTLTQVSLALGHAELLLTPVGTLISAEPVAPIVPMGVLAAELDCKVNWEGETCRVIHPKRGKLPIVMVNRCPELCAKITEELIAEIEDKRALVMQRALRLKAIAVGVGQQGIDEPVSVDAMLEWLQKLSPDCPKGILARVPPVWQDDLEGEDVPFNRRVRRAVQRADKVVLHLFSGRTKPQDFGQWPSSVYVLSVDLERGLDILSDGLYQYLLELCSSGKVIAVVGGALGHCTAKPTTLLANVETPPEEEEDDHNSWAALRVTWGMQAGPHSDRNMKDTKNWLVVPQPKSPKLVAQIGRDPQYFDISTDSEEDSSAGEWEGTGEPKDFDQRVARLLQLVREEEKALIEELRQGLTNVTPCLVAELQEDLRIANLLQEQDGCEHELERVRSKFALHKLVSVERELEQAWCEVEKTSLPQVRAIKVPAESSQEVDHDPSPGLGPACGSVFALGDGLVPGESPPSLHQDFGLETPEIVGKGACAVPGALLQTRIVSQAEVWKNLEQWRQPLTDEVVALKDLHRAVWAIGPEELKRLEELAEVSVIPAKGVYTQKPITNRLRARIVGCGNFLEGEPPAEDAAKGRTRSQDLYAGGVDGVSVRLQTSVAAIKGWGNATLDIKTAFLGAPLYQDRQGQAVLSPGDLSSGRLDFEMLVRKLKSVQGNKVKIVVVTPPRVLVSLGLVEESEKWLVLKALYGLAEAPRRWSSHRDMLLRQHTWEDCGRRFFLKQCVADSNLWKVVSEPLSGGVDVKTESEPVLHGLLGIYVDDMLITAEEPVKVGKPVRFCGFNLHKLKGGGYLLNQEDYIQDLLQSRYMLADVATKALQGQRHRELVQLLEMRSPTDFGVEVRKVRDATLIPDLSIKDSACFDHRAMGVRTLVLAVVLSVVASKLTVIVEDHGGDDWLAKFLLVVSAVLAVLAVGLMRRFCAVETKDPAEVRSVRPSGQGEDEEDDWSVVGNATDAVRSGLEFEEAPVAASRRDRESWRLWAELQRKV
ncbi:hypothetical protein AK812_SmicGene16922 [Symbiodinium microadriaticum]|uniref:Retrovirus-related Pol polyprotein from transposon TNT 1-94 n=1 Tax=Symbiodinium microadriaticum TaxID=2951 RepID=A0A1Q9DZ05_SYMMI|nr:hypothetical protein AK812_SmicGene16922 [Symbiodinium microadriaticum]